MLRIRYSRAVTAAVALMSFAACAPARQSQSETSSQSALQGGHTTTGEPSVGLLFAHAQSGFVLSSCTATLIAPRVILSAAHCFATNVPDTFYLGSPTPIPPGDTDWEKATVGMRRISLSHYSMAPGYVPNDMNCPNTTPDLAIAELDEVVTDIAPTNVSFDAPALGSECTVVGMGRHSLLNGTPHDTFGKRDGTVTIDSTTSTSFDQGSVADAVPLAGDSGGPLLCNGSIVAVDSCGAGDADAQTNQDYARTDIVATWIRAQLANWAMPGDGADAGVDANPEMPTIDGGAPAVGDGNVAASPGEGLTMSDAEATYGVLVRAPDSSDGSEDRASANEDSSAYATGVSSCAMSSRRGIATHDEASLGIAVILGYCVRRRRSAPAASS